MICVGAMVVRLWYELYWETELVCQIKIRVIVHTTTLSKATLCVHILDMKSVFHGVPTLDRFAKPRTTRTYLRCEVGLPCAIEAFANVSNSS